MGHQSPYYPLESTLLIHLICPVRHGEGELVGVLLFFTGVDVLDAARCQIGLGERADSGAWWEKTDSY